MVAFQNSKRWMVWGRLDPKERSGGVEGSEEWWRVPRSGGVVSYSKNQTNYPGSTWIFPPIPWQLRVGLLLQVTDLMTALTTH